MKFRLDWFLLALTGAVLLAIAYPHFGARGGVLHPELTNKIGVALIFFLHGVGLSFQALKAGTLHWRLHLVVQFCTFIAFPALGLLLYFGGRYWYGEELGAGLFFLSALPSTVSSSVALTAVARGNVAAALFNATVSSLIGIVLTPIWMSFILAAQPESPSVGGVMVDLCQWLVLPLALGQAARPVLARWVSKQKKRIQIVDRWTILFLVYTSFCDSVLAGVWKAHGLSTVALIGGIGLGMFFAIFALSRGVSRKLGFPVADQIATIFCASKKSMATGVPMAQLMFGHSPMLGIFVLPLLIYHTLQLVVAGTLAERWSKRVD